MSLNRNLNLEKAILETRKKKYELAWEADMTPSKLSYIIHGIQKPTTEEQERLSAVLQVDTAYLFPSSTDSVHA